MGGGGCFDDHRKASLQEVLWKKACPDCVSDHCLDARFVCNESSQVCSDVSRSFVPDSALASTECRLRLTVLRETWEELFERPLPNLVADFCSPLFLKDCVAVYSQDVVDAADSHTLGGGKFRLRVLAKLNAFVHCSNDASSGSCGDLAMFCASRHSRGAASRSFTL